MSEKIDEMKARIELAEATERDLNGKSRDGLTLTEIGDYTIVDDGQDRWIQSTNDYNEALESLIGDILSGDLEPDPDEGYLPAYDQLCSADGCLYSRIGTPSDIDELVDDLDCDTPTMLEIFDALGIDEEYLPAMVKVVWDAGERFHGNAAVDIARDWIDNDFDADDASEWMDAGFWDASTAAQCRDAGMDADDAAAAEAVLIQNSEDDDEYTDGSPIYSICNNDTPVSVLIDAHNELAAENAVD